MINKKILKEIEKLKIYNEKLQLQKYKVINMLPKLISDEYHYNGVYIASEKYPEYKQLFYLLNNC